MSSPVALVTLVAGLVAGVGLAIWGLRLTKFECNDSGYFYTPNAHIGIALSLLFVARIGFRLLQVAILTGPDVQFAAQDFGRSPLTLAVVGMMAGYYAWYAIGLLRWRATATDSPGAIK
jgi:hypothetical protein